jgi:hypothetical protein
MSRRIEVELTSSRDDGSWTWRAAGAKQPKGDLDGALLYPGAKVGDIVRAEADFLIDGIVITAVLPPKGARKEPELLEIIGPPRKDEELVTTTLAPRGRGERGDRPHRDGDRDRRPRPDGDRARRPRSDGDRTERRPRSEGAPGGRSGGDRERERRRPERPAPEPKPKPKRLRAGRVHRNEVMAALPDEQKPIAEQVLRGGIPAVRQAVEKQNEANRAEGKPEISPEPLTALAEQLMPALRSAEWHDKADAALAEVAEVDLRDLRSVVVAADVGARDEETRELAEKLRVALDERVEAEQAQWLAETTEMLDQGRAVRALRLSSRPPKPGEAFPPELLTRLAEAASAAMTADTGSDRFATVLDALAYSPVRGQVTAQGVPAEPSDELLKVVRKFASRMPQIATQFGIEPPAPARGKGRPRVKGKGESSGRPVPPPPKASAPRPPGAPIPPPPGPRRPAPASATTAGGSVTATRGPADPRNDEPTPTGSPEPVAAVEAAEQPAAALDPGTEPVAAVEAGEQPVAALDPGTEPVAAVEAAEQPAAALDPGTEPVTAEAVEDVDSPASATTSEDVASGSDPEPDPA